MKTKLLWLLNCCLSSRVKIVEFPAYPLPPSILQETSVTTKTVPTGTVKFSGSVPSECDRVQNSWRAITGEPWQRSVTSDAGSCPTWVLGKFVTNTLRTCDAEADTKTPVVKAASTAIVTMTPSFLFKQLTSLLSRNPEASPEQARFV